MLSLANIAKLSFIPSLVKPFFVKKPHFSIFNKLYVPENTDIMIYFVISQ